MIIISPHTRLLSCLPQTFADLVTPDVIFEEGDASFHGAEVAAHGAGFLIARSAALPDSRRLFREHEQAEMVVPAGIPPGQRHGLFPLPALRVLGDIADAGGQPGGPGRPGAHHPRWAGRKRSQGRLRLEATCGSTVIFLAFEIGETPAPEHSFGERGG